MPFLPLVHRRRERRTAQRRLERYRHALGVGVGYTTSALLALALLTVAFGYAELTRDLPSPDLLPTLLHPTQGALLQPTRLYDRTGKYLLFTLAPSDSPRRYIPLNRIPVPLQQAIQVALDPRFPHHPGFLLDELDDPSAHPTLAQTLAYDFLLFHEPPSLRRALRERLLAAQITARFGREQILEWYLNTANFGNYAFGVGAAASFYFGKSAEELTLTESALLAAAAQVPSLNPLDAPQAASQRAHELLVSMQALGLIEQVPPISFEPPVTSPPTPPEFFSLLLRQLASVYDVQRLERGGVNIITTLEYDLQQSAICLTQLYTVRLVNEPAAPIACEAARYLSAIPPVSLLQPGVGVLVLDPGSGQILAMAGVFPSRPAGTLLTPFIYLTGFTRGLGPASLVWDIPRDDLTPTDGRFQGPMRLRIALANDYLAPALEVLDQMGRPNVINTARSFGLDLDPGATFLFDSSPQTLLDLASAYGILATLGTRNGQRFQDSIRPSLILRIETVDGALWLDWKQPLSQSIVAPPLAYLINDVLSDEPARWPSWGNPNPTQIGRPVAIKGGWTNGPDAWLIGYTPSRLVGVWVGELAPLAEKETLTLPPRLPAVLWAALMQVASASQPAEDWLPPEGSVEVEVCDPSGLLPTPYCPNIVREVFLAGFEPVQADTLFQTYPVNRETGLLATVFTPPELVEERVFLDVPERARPWAFQAGLPLPPQTYDAIQPPPPNPNANITSPSLFAEVQGRVPIVGTAAGSGFRSYFVQIGQGLYPQRWQRIAEATTPVFDGSLADWDTSGLQGLYAIQLSVVYADQRLETATVLVVVRNSP